MRRGRGFRTEVLACRAGAARERGTTTAELAVVLPALVLLSVLGIWGVLVGAAYLRCVDAAGVGARALARGEPDDVVRSVAADVAPDRADVRLSRDGELVVVEVRVRVGLPGGWNGAGVLVGDRAVAVDEAGVTASEPVAEPQGVGP